MSYQKYQTEALVLRTAESGEADRVLTLYTKEFGLVRARASAIRRESSKMRYGLQSYARADVSLIRGNRGWRAAGAQARAAAPRDPASLTAFARIARLVERLIAGEERNDYLYATLAEAHEALSRSSAQAIELVCVARTLYALGYLSPAALGSALFAGTAYGETELSEADAGKEALTRTVNKAIAETQM